MTVPGKDLIQSDGEIKSFSDKQKFREFSTTKPVSQQILETLIASKHKRKERPTKQTQNNQENANRNIYINNYLKCKWIKCINQKLQTE